MKVDHDWPVLILGVVALLFIAYLLFTGQTKYQQYDCYKIEIKTEQLLA